MVHFRYHLVSIIAVLLALAIGIVLGSGFLGETLLNQLEAQLNVLDAQNQRLIRQGDERQRALESYTEFARSAQMPLIHNALLGEEVMLLTLEGTNGDSVATVRGVIEQAGGAVPVTVTMLNKLELGRAQDRSELAAILDTVARAPGELRRSLAATLATGMSEAALMSPTSVDPGDESEAAPEAMLGELEDAGFVDVEGPPDGGALPPGTLFLIVAGDDELPAFDPREFFKTLGTRLSEQGAVVLAAEPFGSNWGITESICEDTSAIEEISTVEQADTIPGQTAVVLGLEGAELDGAGHYGVGSCATEVIPEASQAG